MPKLPHEMEAVSNGPPSGDERNRFAAFAEHVVGGQPLPDAAIDDAVAANDIGLIFKAGRLASSHERAAKRKASAGLDAGLIRRHRLAAARGEAVVDRLVAAFIERGHST